MSFICRWLIRAGLSSLPILCAGCIWCSVGYKVQDRKTGSVQIEEVDGRFVIRSVKTEVLATGYAADYTGKHVFRELTPEKLNRFLISEYPKLFSSDGTYPLDLAATAENSYHSHGFWFAGAILSFTLIPLPIDGFHTIRVEGVSEKNPSEVLFRCGDGIRFSVRGWWSFLPTGAIPSPFETDTPKEAIVTDMQFGSGLYGERAQALLIEKVSRSIIEGMKQAGMENLKRKILLTNM